MPSGKEFLQYGALGEVAGDQGVVGGGVPMDAARAKAENAEACAAAVGFGEIAVVFQAELMGVE